MYATLIGKKQITLQTVFIQTTHAIITISNEKGLSNKNKINLPMVLPVHTYIGRKYIYSYIDVVVVAKFHSVEYPSFPIIIVANSFFLLSAVHYII